nr:serine/threonine-protein kinase haspin-like [Rhipicephalus microplus]
MSLSRDDCLKCRKLGEGCTADVYLLQRPNGEESVVKVIPVGSERNIYGELPMPLANIITEGVITRELSNLRLGQMNQTSTFIKLKRASLASAAFHAWSRSATWASFSSLGTIQQLESIFLQVACSLAVAELELEFEHRDLHCDNVLVKRTEQDCIKFMLNGRELLVRTAGVKASIIDYTLSRMRKGREVVYTDVSHDTALFKGIGSSHDDWEAYHPRTNALWLSYLLHKLTDKLPRTKQAAKVSTSGGRLASWADALLALPSAEALVVEHVALQLERKAEVLPEERRRKGPQTKEPDARSTRTRYALRWIPSQRKIKDFLNQFMR